MANRTVKQLALLLGLCLILMVLGCGAQEPDISGVDSIDSIFIRYEDGEVIKLAKSSPYFEEIAEEGMRTIVCINKSDHWWIFDYEFEKVFPQVKYVQLNFAEPVTVTTRCKVPRAQRGTTPANEEGYLLLDLSSFVRITFRGVNTEVDEIKWFEHLEFPPPLLRQRGWKGVLVAYGPWKLDEVRPPGVPEEAFELCAEHTDRDLGKLEKMVDDLR